MVTDNPVINEPIYFNLFECGKNILNRLDATCEQACMITSRYKYYTEMFNNIPDYNDRNNGPLSNKKIRESVHNITDKESKSDANNVTADTSSHTLNTQRYNANAIFTSEKLDKSDELADTLKYLTINDAEYYVANSATKNDAKGDPASNPKTVTHTSDRKGKVMDTINGIINKKY